MQGSRAPSATPTAHAPRRSSNEAPASPEPLRPAEVAVVGAVFLLVWSLLGFFLWSDIYRHSDTAALVYMTEATGKYGLPYNQVSISDYDAADVKPLDAAAACSAPLTPGPESYPNGQFSHFEYHAYYFVYALAPLTWFFPAEVVIGATQGLAMTATVLLVYVILRQERTHILGAVLFCGLIGAYPVWNQALSGVFDLYMDRYFPPLDLLYLAILYYGLIAPGRPWARAWPWAIPVGILAASTNDRSILYVILANVSMLLLLGRRALPTQRRAALLLLGFSTLLLLAFFAYMNWVHTSNLNTIPGFVGRISDLVALFTNPAPFRFAQTYAELSVKFLVVNVVLFGIWGFFRWKLMLMALAAMLPNILTTIGGAEKIQWGFHYHAQYLPFILFAAAIGFAGAWRTAHGVLPRLAVVMVLGISALGLVRLDAYQPGWSFGQSGAVQNGLYAVGRFYEDGPRSAEAMRRSLAEEVDRAIPKGVNVTSSQNLAGPLYAGRHWFYYPIGIDTADYAVLPIEDNPDGSHYFGGAESYTGDAGIRELNQCLTQRLERDGFNVRDPQIIGGLAILRKAG